METFGGPIDLEDITEEFFCADLYWSVYESSNMNSPAAAFRILHRLNMAIPNDWFKTTNVVNIRKIMDTTWLILMHARLLMNKANDFKKIEKPILEWTKRIIEIGKRLLESAEDYLAYDKEAFNFSMSIITDIWDTFKWIEQTEAANPTRVVKVS